MKSSLKFYQMSNSRNWKALAIPSIDGKKIELDVSGEVQSGIVPPRLTKRDTNEMRPPNVITLNVSGVGGGQYVTLNYSEDITGHKYGFVFVFNERNEIEAAMPIETVNS
jgi:hypothetical protein